MSYWGYHQMLDCGQCDKELISSASNIKAFAIALVNKIDMVAFGDPQVVHFGSSEAEGYTLVQLIETSNICAHFSESSLEVYLDVFSCKAFDPLLVEDTVIQFFKPMTIRKKFFIRDAKLKD